jgi:hypothetical protein
VLPVPMTYDQMHSSQSTLITVVLPWLLLVLNISLIQTQQFINKHPSEYVVIKLFNKLKDLDTSLYSRAKRIRTCSRKGDRCKAV